MEIEEGARRYSSKDCRGDPWIIMEVKFRDFSLVIATFSSNNDRACLLTRITVGACTSPLFASVESSFFEGHSAHTFSDPKFQCPWTYSAQVHVLDTIGN